MKKTQFEIGVGDKGPVHLDLNLLIQGRMAATASSGGGKTSLVLKILELTYGHIPQVVLDREGDFTNLADGKDYVVFGRKGHMQIHPGMAAQLARYCMELNISVIIDLSEMDTVSRHRFVRLFVQEWIDAPERLWRPRLMVIDEAHQFCPENGEGVSEAKGAILELCSLARKRWVGLILATQRVAKLDKSALSECRNLIVGFHNRHDDRKSIGKELGFSKKEDLFGIWSLEAGEFWVRGPAIHKEVVKIKVNPPACGFVKRGFGRVIKAPKPTKKVLELLGKLKDMPKEAEKEAKTIEELSAKVKELTAKLKQAEKAPAPSNVTAIIPAPSKAIMKEAEKLALDTFEKKRKDLIQEFLQKVRPGLDAVLAGIKAVERNPGEKPILAVVHQLPTLAVSKPTPTPIRPQIQPKPSGQSLTEEAKALGAGPLKILAFLAMRPDSTFSNQQVSVMTGFRPSGTFNTYLSRLAGAGLIVRGNGTLRCADLDQAKEALGPNYRPQSQNSLEEWLQRLGKGPGKIYQLLLENPNRSFTVQEVAEAVGQAVSGTLNTYISRVAGVGLAVRENGTLKLNPDIQNL